MAPRLDREGYQLPWVRIHFSTSFCRDKSRPIHVERGVAFDIEEHRRLIDDPSGRCLLVGVPRITSMPLPIKIVQTKDEVIFLYETFHAFRVIPTDGRGHPDDIDPSFMGDSVGRWEGDTLVVDVIGFNDKTWLGAGGATLHTDALHVIERYRRVDMGHLQVDLTFEDPGTFTKPFHNHSTWTLAPGEEIEEYVCNENNRDVQHLTAK